MFLSGTVVPDASTIIKNGAVVVEGTEIVAVDERQSVRVPGPDRLSLTDSDYLGTFDDDGSIFDDRGRVRNDSA